MGATSIADSDDGAVRNLVIGGRCEQGDNPSPDNPQEIKCVEGCTMTVSSADGTKRQEAAIPVTLLGIGDVRDELYVYADGTGKLVQRIKHRIITVDDNIFVSGMSTEDYKNFGILSIADLFPQHINGFANIISNRFSRGKRQNFNVQNTVFPGGNNSDILYFCVSAELAQSPDDFRTFLANNQVYVLYEINQVEKVLTAEQMKALSNLRTHYGGTNITYSSDNGVEPVINFDYACALEAFVEHVKTQQGDTREMIYNMDDRLTQAEVTALEAAIDAQIAQAMMEV